MEEARDGFLQMEHRRKAIPLNIEKIMEALAMIIPEVSVKKGKISAIYRKFLIEENMLFQDLVRGVLYPQGQLVRLAIEELT